MEPIKLGIIGTGRGKAFMSILEKFTEFDLRAVCDRRQDKLDVIKEKYPNVQTFTAYDEMLKSDIEAVLLANFFDEHAPFAIKALKAGKHVLSECVSNITLAEGVELCRTVEQTGKIYMLAENYPYFACNLTMKRCFESGAIGRALFTEGEYNHPVTPHDKNMLAPCFNHWRNWLPRS